MFSQFVADFISALSLSSVLVSLGLVHFFLTNLVRFFGGFFGGR